MTAMAVDPDSRTTPQQRYTRYLGQVTEHTPTEVRRVLRSVLCAGELKEIVDDALFVATELLTNVWKHTDGRCHLTVLLGSPGVHILVRDFSTDLPVQVSADAEEESGRGVVAVGAYATTFQVQELPDGKILTAFLAAPKRVGATVADDGKGHDQ